MRRRTHSKCYKQKRKNFPCPFRSKSGTSHPHKPDFSSRQPPYSGLFKLARHSLWLPATFRLILVIHSYSKKFWPARGSHKRPPIPPTGCSGLTLPAGVFFRFFYQNPPSPPSKLKKKSLPPQSIQKKTLPLRILGRACCRTLITSPILKQKDFLNKIADAF